jgi:hypothetical protein
MMTSGIETLMRSFGVDPAKIMQAMQPVIEQSVGVLTKELKIINDQQARSETRLARMEDKLDAIIFAMKTETKPVLFEEFYPSREGGKLDNA